MHDHESLPEDPEDWPNDPARLLGVSQSTDQPTIKRAYLKLVRRFKPDAFPRQFQRIRAAYEALMQRFPQPSTAAPPAAEPSPATREPTAPNTQNENSYKFDRTVRVRPDNKEENRKLIKAGEFDQLRQRVERELVRGNADLGTLLAVYLLRQATPDHAAPIQAQIDDEDLLLQIFRRSTAAGMNLLGERLRINPAFARSESFHKYLERVSDPQSKVELLLLKWGCLEINDWHTVLDDFDRQRNWLLDHPDHWAHLGSECLKFTTWNQSSERARNFVKSFSLEFKSVAYNLQDRLLPVLDEVSELVKELAGRQTAISAFDWRLVAHFFTRHPWLLSLDLGPLWEAAQRQPLRLLDEINQTSAKFPRTVSVLRELIRQSYKVLVDDQQLSFQDHSSAIAKFLGQQKKRPYLSLRPAILKFCESNGFDFARFSRCADALVADQSGLPKGSALNKWNELWRNDPGFDCVSMLLQLPFARPSYDSG